jgi:hypothetical protein
MYVEFIFKLGAACGSKDWLEIFARSSGTGRQLHTNCFEHVTGGGCATNVACALDEYDSSK